MDGSSTTLAYLPSTIPHVQAFNESSHVSEAFQDTAKALTTYAVPVICVLGIVGDVTSFCIFVFTSFRYQPCSQYLAALTFVDTLFLISQLINCLMTYVPELAFAPGYCSIMVYLSYVCSFLSAWFVVLMMVERYLVVCHPFRTRTLGHKRKPMVSILVLVVVSACLYSHSFFSTTTTNTGHCSVGLPLYNFVVVFTFVDSFLAFVVPVLIIVWCSLRIILEVHKFRKRYTPLKGGAIFFRSQPVSVVSLAQVRSTKMLVWVSSAFVVLYLPSYATRLCGMVIEQMQAVADDAETQLIFAVAQQLCQMLYYVNFAVDFLVFFVSSSNFRRHFFRCFRCD